MCVFDRLDAPEAQSVLCLSVLKRAAHARANTHTHTHTRTHTHTHAHTLQPEEQRFSCGLYFQRFIIKHVQQFSNCKEAFYNNRQTIDLILTVRFGQGGTNARRCEGKDVVLEETRL